MTKKYYWFVVPLAVAAPVSAMADISVCSGTMNVTEYLLCKFAFSVAIVVMTVFFFSVEALAEYVG